MSSGELILHGDIAREKEERSRPVAAVYAMTAAEHRPSPTTHHLELKTETFHSPDIHSSDLCFFQNPASFHPWTTFVPTPVPLWRIKGECMSRMGKVDRLPLHPGVVSLSHELQPPAPPFGRTTLRIRTSAAKRSSPSQHHPANSG